MVGFRIVGKKRGRRFFLKKEFRTRTTAERAIARARMRAMLRAREIRRMGRIVIPARVSEVRVVQRTFRRKRR